MENLPKTFISIDAETNGLWGDPFQIGAVLVEDGTIKQEKTWKCPIKGDINPWVEQNVLPKIENIPNTHSSLDEMLQDFANWYLSNKNMPVLWHMGHVVEVYLFRLLVEKGYIGEFDAPYTPIELSMLLQYKGFAPDSVDGYLKEKAIKIDNIEGGVHNALYDAFASALCYLDLIK
jgi:DNA polymerase III epsilon subunit-like protein